MSGWGREERRQSDVSACSRVKGKKDVTSQLNLSVHEMKCGPKMGKMSFDKELCTYVLVHCNVNLKLFVCGDFFL